MRRNHHLSRSGGLIALAACLSLVCATASAQSDLEWKVARTFAVPGGGHCAGIALTDDGQRLWLVRMSHVQELSTRSGDVIADIAGLDQAVAVALDMHDQRAFVCEAGADRVAIIDMRSGAKLGAIAVESHPLAVACDGTSGMVLVGCAGTRALVRFPELSDPAHHDVPMRMALLATPVAVAVDAEGRAIVACADEDQAVAVDGYSLVVCARDPLGAGEAPRGLALDRIHHRIFIATTSKRLDVLDGDYGDVIAQLRIGADAGMVAFHDQLIYAACGDGTLSLLHEVKPSRYSPLARVATLLEAKALAVDPVHGTAYLAVDARGAAGGAVSAARVLAVSPPTPEIADGR